MKLKVFLCASICCILASCNNSQKADNDSSAAVYETAVQEDTIIISNDSCIADCVENDSIVVRGGSTSEGFGRCSKCNCKEFEGRGQTCRNCGHAYKAHY